jgi:hypothetical protein
MIHLSRGHFLITEGKSTGILHFDQTDWQIFQFSLRIKTEEQ